MLKKTIKFTDYNGVDNEEVYYFNLSKIELMEMELFGQGGSFSAWIEAIVAAEDNAVLFAEFKKLILAAYGQKAIDGKSFLKSDQLSKDFSQTLAFESLFMELATVSDAAVEFIKGVVPADMAQYTDGSAPAPEASSAPAIPSPPERKNEV